MHPIFEAVYVPAFIKAANAEGRVFADLEDLGKALKLAAEREAQEKKAAFLRAAGGLVKGLAGRGAPAAANAAAGARGAAVQGRQAVRALPQSRADFIKSLQGQRITAGSPLHKQLQRMGGVGFKRPAAAGGPRMAPQAQQAAVQQAQRLRTMPQAAKAQQARAARLGRVSAQDPAQAGYRVGQAARSGVAAAGNKVMDAGGQLALRGQQALASGLGKAQEAGGAALDAGRRAVHSPLGAAALGGGAVLGGQALMGPKQAALNEKLARLKVAARIINADIGLDQLINHMKKAKAKKVAQA